MTHAEKAIIDTALRLAGGRSRPDKSWPFIRAAIQDARPVRVCDAGCGRGTFGALVKMLDPGIKLVGLDIFPEYLDGPWLNLYDAVLVGDLTRDLPLADLYLFVDVLEHLDREEALAVVGLALQRGAKAVASIPNESGGGKHWHQAPEFEAANPHEAHRHDWTNQEVEDALGLFLVGEKDGLGVYTSWKVSA